MAQLIYKIRLKKGDRVMVRIGKFRGQVGKVIAVHPRTNKVTVEGINVVKKYIKKTQATPQGGVKEVTIPINVSKVGIVEPTSKKPSRIKYRVDGDKKVRVYASTNKEVA
jgi:large subunit ribosomal protein L24